MAIRYYDATTGLYRTVYGQHVGDYLLEPPDDAFVCDECEQRRTGDEWCDDHECCWDCCEIRHCPECGRAYDDEAVFCYDCGDCPECCKCSKVDE